MEEVKKITPQLSPGRIKGSEFARIIYVATVEENTSQETINNPNFWSHGAQRFKPYDRIEVRCDDESFFAELLVLDVGRGWAKVKELAFYDLGKQEKAIEDKEFELKWKGPQLKWCVIRKSDGERIQEGMDKHSANSWLADFLKGQ